MLTAARLPPLGNDDFTMRIDAIHVTEGQVIVSGTPLVDIDVDASQGMTYDCPPISSYRIVAHERGWIGRIAITADAPVEVGALLLLIGDGPDLDFDRTPDRDARLSMASIIKQRGWW